MNKIILVTGSIVVRLRTEFFIAWYSGNQYERFTFLNRAFGPYWWDWWCMLSCNDFAAGLLVQKVPANLLVVYFVSMCVNIGMWFERFVIIVAGLHRDFLPSSWGFFIPTWVDICTFIGTFGMFLRCSCCSCASCR